MTTHAPDNRLEEKLKEWEALAEHYGQLCLDDAETYTITWDQAAAIERRLREACAALRSLDDAMGATGAVLIMR